MKNNTILNRTENKRGDFCFVFDWYPSIMASSKVGKTTTKKTNKQTHTNKNSNKHTNKQINGKTNTQNSSFILSK